MCCVISKLLSCLVTARTGIRAVMIVLSMQRDPHGSFNGILVDVLLLFGKVQAIWKNITTILENYGSNFNLEDTVDFNGVSNVMIQNGI